MKYRTGLVVGKFAPLTRGHEELIRTAAEQCEELIILSYTSANYGKYSDYAIRRKSLDMFAESLYPAEIHIRVFDSYESYPRDDDPEEEHRAFCADHLLNIMDTTVQAVFSSEEYGEGFAKYLQDFFNKELGTNMTVDNVVVDLQRKTIPISATKVRAMDVTQARNDGWISPYVASLLMPKVLILGGESSGKTTLAEALAERLDTVWVPEYGRELWNIRGGNLFYEDMEKIAEIQIDNEYYLGIIANKYLICDTSPLTTVFYSQKLFNRVSFLLDHIATESNYDVIFICGNDIPFTQDGTRRDPNFRDEAYNFYLNYYQRSTQVILHGTVEERVNQAVAFLELKERPNPPRA
jgi:NadR type nicotinamide-nucleotide adenylyltransferase